ncbi:antitoxin YefM [Actinoplanes octamycinicus]|uniref:Antitoxin n=1 Tax=Actinoplanes octamycinicus TaxID=135948 RepID=A0A7W7GQT1_9ACTN|nr:type II toxin-antitoxin system prevent-host-death family antitoxin [Actinoplanes octamycinicus]MBB4736610.1 antitoxin YefM [Actinoplanes octamycinicus]GIE62974.1 antitoxin YefM [Actinoplanes octamycinicus]
MAASISADEAGRTLDSLIDRVNKDHTTVEVVSERGSAVLISKAEWDSIVETDYLLRSPANVKHLMESMEQWRGGS